MVSLRVLIPLLMIGLASANSIPESGKMHISAISYIIYSNVERNLRCDMVYAAQITQQV